MQIIVIAILIVIGVTIPLGIIAFFIFRSKGSKHPFILLSRDGKSANVVTAVLKTDPQNSSKKQFVFSTLNTFLPIAKPNWYFNRIGYRIITQDNKGDYSYVEPKLVESTFEFGLTPEEKELALFRYRENQKRYENPMNKMQAAMVIAGFILVLIIMIGVIYSTIAYVNASSNVVKMTHELNEMAKTNHQAIQTMQQISLQQTQIIASLQGQGNVTINRQLS